MDVDPASTRPDGTSVIEEGVTLEEFSSSDDEDSSSEEESSDEEDDRSSDEGEERLSSVGIEDGTAGNVVPPIERLEGKEASENEEEEDTGMDTAPLARLLDISARPKKALRKSLTGSDGVIDGNGNRGNVGIIEME